MDSGYGVSTYKSNMSCRISNKFKPIMEKVLWCVYIRTYIKDNVMCRFRLEVATLSQDIPGCISAL